MSVRFFSNIGFPPCSAVCKVMNFTEYTTKCAVCQEYLQKNRGNLRNFVDYVSILYYNKYDIIGLIWGFIFSQKKGQNEDDRKKNRKAGKICRTQ